MITKENYNRVIVRDKGGYQFKQIESMLKAYPSNYTVMEAEDFLKALPTMEDTLILGYGYDLYQELRQMDQSGVIHFGLRSYDWNSFASLPSIQVGSNKLLFGQKIRLVDEDSILDPEGNVIIPDIVLSRYFSDSVFRTAPTLPDCRCVGLKEGLKILNEEFYPIIGTKEVGLDFEANGFPEWEGFEVTGFALSTTEKAVFFDFRKDEGYWDIGDRSAFLDSFKQYMELNQSHIWAYNCAYEMLVLYRMFHKHFYIQDSFALCVVDDQRKSLKYNVQYYLAAPSWDDSLSDKQEYIVKIKKLCPTYEVFKNRLVDGYLTEPKTKKVWVKAEEVDQYLIDNKGSKTGKTKVKETKKSKTVEEEIEIIIKPENTSEQQEIIDYYTKDGKFGVDGYPRGFFLNLLCHYWDKPGTSWLACNPQELGIYCCYDSFYGLKLMEFIYPVYGDNCYPSMLYNKYMAMELKLGGIKINREKMEKYKDYCDNIVVGFEIFANRLYLEQYFNHQKNIYDSLVVDPYLLDFSMKYPGCVSGDPGVVGKEFLSSILTPEERDYIDKNLKIRDGLISEKLGVDVNDEVEFINDYTDKGAASLPRRKACLEALGELIIQITGMKTYIESFNKIAFPVLSVQMSHITTAARKGWALPSIDVTQAYKVVDGMDAWRKLRKFKISDKVKGSEHYLDFKEYFTKKYGLEISDDDALIAFKLPDSVKDAVRNIRDLSDKELLPVDIKTWAGKDFLALHSGVTRPEGSASNYLFHLSKKLEMDTFPKVTHLTDKQLVGTKYESDPKSYIGSIMNYWSNEQFPRLMGTSLKEDYADEALIAVFCWDFCKKIDYLERTREKVLEALGQFKDHLGLLKETQEAYDFTHYSLEDKDNPPGAPMVWKMDYFGCKANSCSLSAFYSYIDDDPKSQMTTEVPTDPFYKMSKFAAMIDFASVAKKEVSTYINGFKKDGYKKVRYPDSVSGFFEDNPDEIDTYLPSFSMNTLTTKRCSSGFHTYLHHSNSMECLTVDEGRIKTYFDVSQIKCSV